MNPPQPMLTLPLAAGRRAATGAAAEVGRLSSPDRRRCGRSRARLVSSRHEPDPAAWILAAVFDGIARRTTFDGELVAVGERHGQATQDFAAVARAVFSGDPAAAEHLRFVAFDLLSVADEDIRARSWRERDAHLRETLPISDRIRMISSQSATPAAHDAIVALGFEGTVLKRPGSAVYRAGRHRVWLKHKARLTTIGRGALGAPGSRGAGMPCAVRRSPCPRRRRLG